MFKSKVAAISIIILLTASFLMVPAAAAAQGGEDNHIQNSAVVEENDEGTGNGNVGTGGEKEEEEGEGGEKEEEEGEGGEKEEEEGEGEGEGEGGGSFIGDWWGLGEKAQESAYIWLVELGVVILTIGLGGYMLAKRTSVVPAQYRRYMLSVHEWLTLFGTALTAPHFFAVEKWEGLGFAVGVLLAIEVVSGLYGRHLHRHVIRLGRGDESPSILGGFIEITKDALFSRWRWIHRSLTVVTAVVLILHIVTAIGE